MGMARHVPFCSWFGKTEGRMRLYDSQSILTSKQKYYAAKVQLHSLQKVIVMKLDLDKGKVSVCHYI